MASTESLTVLVKAPATFHSTDTTEDHDTHRALLFLRLRFLLDRYRARSIDPRGIATGSNQPEKLSSPLRHLSELSARHQIPLLMHGLTPIHPPSFSPRSFVDWDWESSRLEMAAVFHRGYRRIPGDRSFLSQTLLMPCLSPMVSRSLMSLTKWLQGGNHTFRRAEIVTRRCFAYTRPYIVIHGSHP